LVLLTCMFQVVGVICILKNRVRPLSIEPRISLIYLTNYSNHFLYLKFKHEK